MTNILSKQSYMDVANLLVQELFPQLMQVCTNPSNHLTCICRENDYQVYTVSTSQPRQSQVHAMYYNVIILF